MFKLTFAMVLLLSAFLAGYYVGHQDNSPDIFGMAGQAYGQGRELTQSLQGLMDGKEGKALRQLAQQAAEPRERPEAAVITPQPRSRRGR